MNESQLQTTIMAHVNLLAQQNSNYRYIFHVPNGGYRDVREARNFKRAGVRAGVPDLLWPLPRGKYIGLAMELKAGKNSTTDSQQDWLKWLANQGYCVCVVRDDPSEAIRIFEWYERGAEDK